MNGAILLARWTRHDGDAGIEQVIASQLQIGVTAAKHLGKQRLQPLIDLVEGLLEACAGLPVDLANNLLKRTERFFQIGILRIQIAFAL